MLTTELIKAYLNANYFILEKEQFKFQIGAYSKDFENLFKQYNVNTGSFISAYNPRSQPTIQIQNKDKHRRFKNRLLKDSLRFLEAVSTDPLGNWPPEYGFLVLGVNKNKAIQFGISLCQNAIVYIDFKAVPELILVD
ncbi:MAG: hypothetical protein CBC29_08955 [Methylococcaceae bacterium TMED69]|nr:MAG: hypothetical protein CBC29_08955 [Methylococcaceae bacterium TMED69]